jgi:hypothetical protein
VQGDCVVPEGHHQGGAGCCMWRRRWARGSSRQDPVQEVAREGQQAVGGRADSPARGGQGGVGGLVQHNGGPTSRGQVEDRAELRVLQAVAVPALCR